MPKIRLPPYGTTRHKEDISDDVEVVPTRFGDRLVTPAATRVGRQ